MRVKTSITLPEELLERIDQVGNNRSALIERATLAYLDKLSREERDRRDIEILNRHADEMNREMEDILEYQQGW